MENKGGCLGLIIAGLVVCGIIGSCTGGHSDSDYIVAAHEAVPDYLKSPSTAHFVGNDTVAETSEGREVKGSVDCENSFGATVRVDYIVEETKDGDVTSVDVHDRF